MPAKELKFFGETVKTPVSNIVNDDGTQWTPPEDYTLPVANSTTLGGVKPAAKTDDMTQSVGIDANGALFTAPGGNSNPPIPTPTTADNGKVLGVSNGAYALQEASGGGGGINLYSHRLTIKGNDYYFISLSNTPCNSLSALQKSDFIFGCKSLENPSPAATKFVISVFSSKMLYINVTGTFQGATGADFAVIDLSSETIFDTITPL